MTWISSFEMNFAATIQQCCTKPCMFSFSRGDCPGAAKPAAIPSPLNVYKWGLCLWGINLLIWPVWFGKISCSEQCVWQTLSTGPTWAVWGRWGWPGQALILLLLINLFNKVLLIKLSHKEGRAGLLYLLYPGSQTHCRCQELHCTQLWDSTALVLLAIFLISSDCHPQKTYLLISPQQ